MLHKYGGSEIDNFPVRKILLWQTLSFVFLSGQSGKASVGPVHNQQTINTLNDFYGIERFQKITRYSVLRTPDFRFIFIKT